MKRSKRMLVLVRRLEQGKWFHPDEAALDLRTTRRTIFRDIRMLKELGVPLVSSDGRYGLDLEKWKEWVPSEEK